MDLCELQRYELDPLDSNFEFQSSSTQDRSLKYAN